MIEVYLGLGIQSLWKWYPQIVLPNLYKKNIYTCIYNIYSVQMLQQYLFSVQSLLNCLFGVTLLK